jgi:CheY-like chemotaxis protein
MTKPQLIFVVDDEADARELVGDYLRMHGFEVELCSGGRELREKLHGEKPELIVLDLNMPEEDGLSIIRFLKEHYRIPVIMLTASASTIDRVVGLELGADDYLAKPCEMRELLARIRSVLRRLKFAPSRTAERHLAAIASFDLVGFSRFIQEHETATLAAVDAIFSEIVTPSLVQYRGVLFKMLGDGALIEFASVVEAVEWGVALQTTMVSHPRTELPFGKIVFRLGIAVGDVVLNHNDRAGEGVTLAVRVQEVASPSSVCVSDQAFQFVRGKTSVRFNDGGERQLKNIVTPMRVWNWAPDGAGG